MNFGVDGGFEICRKPSGHGIFDKAFWGRVRETAKHDALPEACGCYVFTLKNGDNIKPWYVGKTEKGTFQSESFKAHKIVYYNDILIEHNGTPLLFFCRA